MLKVRSSKISKNWLINVSEDPDMRNPTIDTERILNIFQFDVS